MNRGWIWRGGALALTLALGVAAFRTGVQVSERDLSACGWLGHVYYAAGLFVLGGLDLGTPVGGPPWARSLLWVVYFLAPLITTSAVVEGVLRLARPNWTSWFRLRNHFVVVGAGRVGLLFLEALGRRRRPFVLVDPKQPGALALELRKRFGTIWIDADIRKRGTLISLRLQHATGVALMTGDDLVNLEAAAKIHQQQPSLPVLAHVADLDLRRQLTALGGKAQTFNAHRLAARFLFDGWLESHLAATELKDTVVIAGFGRFGQTILEELQEHHAATEIREVVVVDHHATRRLRDFRHTLGDHPLKCMALDGDIADPRTWDAVHERLSAAPVSPPFFLVGTDDDTLNLRVAMALRRREAAESRIVVRCFQATAFTESLSANFRIDILAIDMLIRDAISNRVSQWFPQSKR